MLPSIASLAQSSLAGKNILFTSGGRDGHDPKGCVAFLEPWLTAEGAHVQVFDNLSPYADQALMDSMDLIIKVWTKGEIKKPEL